MTRLKLRKAGNSLSTTWPKTLLARMNVKEGDELFAVETQHGVMITPYDPDFERTMRTAEGVFDRFKNAYKELARR